MNPELLSTQSSSLEAGGVPKDPGEWMEENVGSNYTFSVLPPASHGVGLKSLQRKFRGDLYSLDVVKIFRELDLYGREIEVGKHSIRCPWIDKHSEPSCDWTPADSSAVVFEGDHEKPPGFCCLHDHCSNRRIADVVKWAEEKQQGLVDSCCRERAKLPDHSSGPLLSGDGSVSQAEVEPRQLPPIASARDLLRHPPSKPPELVSGLIHRGTKVIIGGGSKSFKTWSLMDLAISVATGQEWWGFECQQKRVLYINFELPEAFSADRIKSIARAKGVNEDDLAFLDVWNLRGYATDINIIRAALTEGAMTYDLVIIDPVYKMLGNRDENNNGDIADLLNNIERITVDTGAAIVFGHHFAKGNSSGKFAIDRMSGAGAWARDPDTIITLTPHEEDDAFTAEFILRNFSPVDPFVVRREHPLMVRDDVLDPSNLKQPGGVKRRRVEEIIEVLDPKGMTATQWKDAANDTQGIGKTRFYELLKEAVERGLTTYDENTKTYRPK